LLGSGRSNIWYCQRGPVTVQRSCRYSTCHSMDLFVPSDTRGRRYSALERIIPFDGDTVGNFSGGS
jgi:hypothetical protein